MNASLLIRRTHMYLGLFLMPWMAMYAASTIVMIHRVGERPPLVKVAERAYPGAFSADATSAQMARQILSDLGMEGAHSARKTPDGTKLIINRQELTGDKRITYTPAEGKVVVEAQAYSTSNMLNRMHRRRGYAAPYFLADAWGFLVELAIVAMIFWSLSGLWLWWELRATRGWGAGAALGGLALLGIFLARI